MYKVPHSIEHNLPFLYKIFPVDFRFLFREKKTERKKNQKW